MTDTPFPPHPETEYSCKYLSRINEFDFHENELLDGTHFHKKGFARTLVMTQRQTPTRKWPIPCMKMRLQGIRDGLDECFDEYKHYDHLSACLRGS